MIASFDGGAQAPVHGGVGASWLFSTWMLRLINKRPAASNNGTDLYEDSARSLRNLGNRAD
jgi:hypothetical protein